MVLCKQRQLWVKRHWEMLQLSFMKMKAFACFYRLWGFVSSVRILAGTAWAFPASPSIACQGLPWGLMDLWFFCRESGTVQHPLRMHGERTRRPGWWAPRTVVLKGHGLTPDPQMPKWESGVVWSPPAVREPESCCPLLWALPSQPLRRLPNCPPSWFISVEIGEQVEDSLVTAFLHLELSLVPFVLDFYVCGL